MESKSGVQHGSEIEYHFAFFGKGREAVGVVTVCPWPPPSIEHQKPVEFGQVRDECIPFLRYVCVASGLMGVWTRKGNSTPSTFQLSSLRMFGWLSSSSMDSKRTQNAIDQLEKYVLEANSTTMQQHFWIQNKTTQTKPSIFTFTENTHNHKRKY